MTRRRRPPDRAPSGPGWRGLPLLLVAFLLPLPLLAEAVPSPPAGVSSSLRSRGPISIQGDDAFVAANGVTGGRGTPEDPYVIEGWEIDAASDPGIRIAGTAAAFLVRDVVIQVSEPNPDFPPQHPGILLTDVARGRLEDVWVSAHPTGLLIEGSSQVMVVRGRFLNNGLGVSVEDSREVLLTDTRAAGNRAGGLSITASRNVTLLRNQVGSQPLGIGVGASFNVVLEENAVTDQWVGIQVGNGTVLVRGNRILRNAVGLVLEDASHVLVTGNHVEYEAAQYTPATGVVVRDSRSIVLTENAVVGFVPRPDLAAEGIGLHLDRASSLWVSRNGISGGHRGIVLQEIHGAVFLANDVSDHLEYGLHAVRSAEVRVFRNNFWNNTVAAFQEAGEGMAFDGGYPLGGNFWSELMGEDRCRGPGQDDCSQADGFLDAPRPVDATGEDRYPRATPFAPADEDPPRVSHVPPVGVDPGEPLTITAGISDASPLLEARLVVRTEASSDWDALPVVLTEDGTGGATVATGPSEGAVEYYFLTVDEAGNVARLPALGAYRVALEPSADPGAAMPVDPVLAAALGGAGAATAVAAALLLRRRGRRDTD